jgi:hypothetical protein
MITEIASGMVSSACISPFMAVIDTAIIKSQFEKKGIFRSLHETSKTMLNNKMAWLKPIYVMNNVYASTYVTANVVESLCKKNDIDYKIPTILATSLVNILGISYKDKEYAKIYGKSNITFPATSYKLFALRDGLTITSSFVVKNNFKEFLENAHGLSENKADFIASFSVPMVAQLISTPIHIYSLDIYNRPDADFVSRINNIKASYKSVCFGRILRIIPAFGIGGYINDRLKQ